MLELKLYCVQIQRNNEVINVTAPEHEIRVLQAMHSPANVRKVAELDPEIESYDVDESAESEIARLSRKYRNNGQERDPVSVAFPNLELDLERYGFKSGTATEEAPRSATNVRKPPKKSKAADAKASDKK